jgi:hypothetical protein
VIPNQWYIFPNIWHNWISDDLHIVVAFVPIDDANTLMDLRYYQRIVKAPVLRQAFNFLGTMGNLVIERQDKRVVITQEPKRADLGIGEKLIPSDGPIIPYRRHRRELIEKAAVAASTRSASCARSMENNRR